MSTSKQTPSRNRFPGSSRRPRRGAAFFLLVLMVLLTVTLATGQLVRRELLSRRGEADRMRARIMLAAIEAVRESDAAQSQPVRLPLVDGSPSRPPQSIEVIVDPSAAQITARWFRGDQIVDTMSQSIEMKSEPQP